MLYVQPIIQRHVTQDKTEILFHEDCDRRNLRNSTLSTSVMPEKTTVGTHHLVKVKVKFTLEQTTRAQRGSRGIVLLFL